MVSRKLRRWRWSAYSKTIDVAGEHIAGDAMLALGDVAADQGCNRRGDAFHYWHEGGYGTFRNSADEDVTIVVVAFGPAPADSKPPRKPARDGRGTDG